MKGTIEVNGDANNKNAREFAEEAGTPLMRENLLSEFSDSEKPLVRSNLNVYSKDDLMTIDEVKAYVSEQILAKITEHISTVDPHGYKTAIAEALVGYILSDGSVPFTGRVKGVEPLENEDLSTKEYVDKVMALHLNENDPHEIMNKVNELLKFYVLREDAAIKTEVYTQEQVNALIKDFVDVNGEKGFNKAVLGKYPLLKDHLSTKSYVDDVMLEHNKVDDAHGLKTYIIEKLEDYVTKELVYTKEETYTRKQIDVKIEDIATPIVQSLINNHLLADDPHGTLATVKEMNFVKSNGSVPFTSPQKGVNGVASNDLVTKSQLDKVESKFDEILNDQMVNPNQWTPSGPVQASVGLVQKGSEFNEPMTLQQIIDAFFYGKSTSIECQEYCQFGDVIPVVVTVRPTSMIDEVKVYQDERLIGHYNSGDFDESGCITIDSLPITTQCVNFRLEVTFTNGTKCADYDTCCVAHALYIGAMPKWLSGSSTSIEYLNQLCLSDPTNNKKFFLGDKHCDYEIAYDFNTPEEPKSIFIAMPLSYPNLDYIYTRSQQIDASHFVTIDNIPYTLPDGQIVIYKLYIFPEGITKMNMNVIYKLECNN